MSKKVIGRAGEQSLLKNILKSNKSEFIALYGRRRIGKTFLIKEFFRAEDCIFFYVMGIQDGTFFEQLSEFTKAISQTFYDGIPLEVPTSWLNVFELLTKAINSKNKRKKIVLFFDELPWIVTPRSRLLGALDYYWNKYWVDNENIKLIVCGSVASWIIKKIIQNKGGLHNRVTRQILLEPLKLGETEQYLHAFSKNFNRRQIAELYMAIGGVPYYLDGVEKGLSASQNINLLCFQKNGLLVGEFDRLFKSLFKNHKAYIELIRIIASFHYGADRAAIVSKAKLSREGGTLSERLNDLEKSGFIVSFLPWQQERGYIYKVIDEFSLFYFRWIEYHHASQFKVMSNEYWSEKTTHHEYAVWAGYAFEALCYKHIQCIRKKLKIPASALAYTWQYRSNDQNEDGAQIDLFFDRHDGVITLCEIKFTAKAFVINKSYAKNLQKKIDALQKATGANKQIFVVMISANGVKENMYSEELISDVVILDDFFEE